MKEPNKTEMKQPMHDEAFRQQAVRLWKQSGQSAELTAPSDSKEVLQAENERLRQELARITEQRVILKKVAGILSEPSHSGMPGLKR